MWINLMLETREYLSWIEASVVEAVEPRAPARTARTNTSGRSPDQPEAEPVQIVAAMRPRAFAPPCLPGSGPLPGLAVPGRGDLFPAAGSVVARRAAPAPAPASRGAAARAVDGPSAAAAVAAAADVPPPQITWQIIVGAVAGVTPFVVAGVEFGKRIIAQKKCEICGGSGLVMKKDYYVRCQGCGGFLPWQSWRRFFTG